MPSAVYLRGKLGREPELRFGLSLTILEAAVAGAGLCVLPGLAGDHEPGLVRVSEPLVDDLTFESWLVLHASTRHQPRIRWVADRLVALLSRVGIGAG